jgi:predicted RNA binding protein YcfA (HicA-like mRNA interferase family)
MHRCEKLLRRAQESPSGLRFEEACQLAECYGYVFARQRGSHRLYKRDGSPRVMNLQADRGMAKEYQVRQLLAVIARDADLEDGRNTP